MRLLEDRSVAELDSLYIFLRHVITQDFFVQIPVPAHPARPPRNPATPPAASTAQQYGR